MKNIGEIYGCYKIIGIVEEKTNDGHKQYIGECIHCKETTIQKLSNFKKELGESCRHYNYLKISYAKFNNNRLRAIWNNMCYRCYDKTDKAYRWYGEKGIKICDEWLNNPLEFKDWALDNGYQDKLTIDRKDSSKDYCPENCRWVTLEKNSKYKSTTRLIEVNGITKLGENGQIF